MDRGPTPMSREFDFKVLGSWEVSTDRGVVAIPSGQLRVLLSSLLLSAGQTVRVDTLAEQLWPERPPVDARGTLHTYVRRLRRLLGHDVILTYPGSGYQLGVSADSVDLHRFRDLMRRARNAASTDRELLLLHEGLRLWRGTPFVDVESTWLERDVVPGITEEWFTATERRIELELARGSSGALIAELRELTSTYPLREALWFRLIDALHRSGRRADALAAYQQVRATLSGELGIDPGVELQQLQRVVLRDGSLDAGKPSTTPVEAVRGPHQLPHDMVNFSGRSADLAALDDLVSAVDTTASQPTIIVAIDGAPGTGKTTLAVRWAHRVVHMYPDVQLYLNLRGYSSGDPVQPAAAVETLLRGLGVASEYIPADLDESSALLRSSLAGRRALLLLDNARDAAQVRPLLPGAGSLVIVTSRNQLRALSIRDGAHRVTLHRLSHAEAVMLLSAAVGPERVNTEPEMAGQLVELCDRLPLALAIVAERAQRSDTLGEVVHALTDEKARLDNFGAGGDDPYTDLRAALSWSYRTLDPAAADMFRKLGLHPANDIGLDAAAALADLPVGRAKQALDQLIAAHMVEQRRPFRYEMHDLIRLYATDQASRHEHAVDSEAGVRRVLDWYLHAAVSADRVLMPHRRRAFVAPYEPTAPAPEFADQGQAIAWFEQEYDCLRSVVRWAAANGWAARAARIAVAMTTFLDRRIPWREGVEFLESAVQGARSVGDRAGEAYTLNCLGCIHLDKSEWTKAQENLRQSLRCFRDVSDVAGEAMALCNLGLAHTSNGDHEDGQRFSLEALRICNQLRYPRGIALNLDNLGLAHSAVGDHERAIECYQQASEILRGLGDVEADSTSQQNLGRAYAAAGRYASAIRSLSGAARAFRKVGNRRWEASLLVDLAKTLNSAGHPGLARGFWEAALVTMKELADPRAQELEAALATTAMVALGAVVVSDRGDALQPPIGPETRLPVPVR
jgi:DNA-binding SARP family transcriptional activator/tetratricopeptide (TPR) repeat protein